MTQFLALIRRTDFTDLFKYGQILLNQKTTIAINEDIPSKDSDGQLLNKLFEHANLFESSFTYLIIEFETNNFDFDNPVVDIESVLNVYPLDFEAKKELETSFDEHIRIANPRWFQAYSDVQRIRTKKDCLKGASNVCRLFKTEEGAINASSIITNDILEELVSELYRNARPYGEIPIWVYLLRYERHAFYPQETVGYFMDTVHVVCDFLGKRETDEEQVAQTSIMRLLQEMPREKKMVEIYSYLQAQPESIPFLEKVEGIENRVNFLLTAVIFLNLKHRYQDGLIYEHNLIKSFMSNEMTRNSFSFASYLLGLVLGHDKTYEALYENLPLKIYKTPEEMESIKRQKEYARWKAAEEMKRMEEEREEDRKQKRRGENESGKTKKSKPTTFGDSQTNYGGRRNQRPFLSSPLKSRDIEEEVPQKWPLNKNDDRKDNESPLTSSSINSNPKSFTVSENLESNSNNKGITETENNGIENNTSAMKPAAIDSAKQEGLVVSNIQEGLTTEQESDEANQTLFTMPEEPIDIPDLPCTMGQLKKGSRTEFRKKPYPVTIESKEEFLTRYKEGWRVINTYNN